MLEALRQAVPNDALDPIVTWIVSAAASLGVVAAAMTKLLPKIRTMLREARMMRDKRTALQNARALRTLGRLIDEWRLRKGANRVLLLDARNGGRPWPAAQPLKVSCIDQAVAEQTENTWARWQDWRADPPYRALLHDLLVSMERDRGILVVTGTMPGGVLRDAYASHGTVASVVFAITWIADENALLYASMNFGRPVRTAEGPSPMSDEERAAYEKQARDLFNDPDRIRGMIAEARQAWDLARG